MSEARTPITSLDLPASYIGRSVARPNAARLLASLNGAVASSVM